MFKWDNELKDELKDAYRKKAIKSQTVGYGGHVTEGVRGHSKLKS